MNRYETPVPRVALGIAAVAMTAITLGVSVVMPAKMDSGRHEPRLFAVSKVTTPASTSPATVTSVDVVAAREPESSTVACNPAKPNHKSES